MLLPGLVAASAQPAGALDYQSVWHCDGVRWNWYCDEQQEAKQEAKAAPEKNPSIKRKHISEMKTAKEIREELERLKDEATANPTEATVTAYLDAQKYVADRGALFADVARRVVWKTPNLDYSLRNPTNATAIGRHKALKEEQRNHTMQDLARENGIFFFFKSDCPYCHALAPTIKLIERTYGMEVIPVSLDGMGLPQYPTPKTDRGAAARLGVQTVPALFLGSKASGDIQPISFGVVSMSEIIERIYVLTQTLPGEPF